jgi:hypothetical protein
VDACRRHGYGVAIFSTGPTPSVKLRA